MVEGSNPSAPTRFPARIERSFEAGARDLTPGIPPAYPRGELEEELERVPRTGSVELVDADHEAHPAGWLYLPDLTSSTGWAAHRVPFATASGVRRIGFRRD